MNFFSDAGTLIKNEVDTALIERLGETQDRCCLAGVYLERDDMIQACLVPDGQFKVLVFNNTNIYDTNACIEREVQSMYY